MFNMYLRETGTDFDLDLWEKNNIRNEILLKFMPFMAEKHNNSWERLPPQELLANFRNIMLVSHCYGANDLVSLSAILRQTMPRLGYSADMQKHALKQIVCITNNNWRDFSDKNGFTTTIIAIRCLTDNLIKVIRQNIPMTIRCFGKSI